MRLLGVFNLVTLDGYFAGEGGDISWHTTDPEFQRYAEVYFGSGNTLLFGRVTYELMASFWPSASALASEPVIARGMNSAPKIVFSRTLSTADWSNTRLVKDNLLDTVRELKQQEGTDLIVLGSGSVIAQLARAGLIDEYQLLLCPIFLGKGKTMFEGVTGAPPLTLKKSFTFGNKSVLLCYGSSE